MGGRRAYALARAGTQVELPEREVEVYGFIETWRAGNRRGFVIECSSGTYVRALVASLGDAYCVQLRRTAVGRFRVEEADPERLLGLDQALDFLPEVRLGVEAARRASHGVAVPASAPAAASAPTAASPPVPASAPAAAGDFFRVAKGSSHTVVRLVDEEGVIALAEPRDGGRTLKPIVGLRGPD